MSVNGDVAPSESCRLLQAIHPSVVESVLLKQNLHFAKGAVLAQRPGWKTPKTRNEIDLLASCGGRATGLSKTHIPEMKKNLLLAIAMGKGC